MVRRAVPGDAESMMNLLTQVLQVHHAGRPDIFKGKGYKYTREQLQTMIPDDENPIFVALDESGTVVGHCFCQIKDLPETENMFARKNLFIDDLCVDEGHRGMHVGSELYGYVKEYAKEHGFYHITLNVWTCNPNALAFYRNMGMTPLEYVMEDRL